MNALECLELFHFKYSVGNFIKADRKKNCTLCVKFYENFNTILLLCLENNVCHMDVSLNKIISGSVNQSRKIDYFFVSFKTNEIVN